MASLQQHGTPPCPVGLPCQPALPATSASGTDLLRGSRDNACSDFPAESLFLVSLHLGAMSLPLAMRWAQLGQAEGEDQWGVGVLLRTGVPFPEGCALILAFPLSGSNAGRCLRSQEGGEKCSLGCSWADTPQVLRAWQC